MTALIDQVDTQLQANLPSFLTKAKAWTAKPLADFDAETPAALYYLAGIESEPSAYDTEIFQSSEHSITVLIVCLSSALDTLRDELLAAMIGFQPTGGSWEGFEHVTGRNQEINGDLVWWSDTFAVRNYRGET